MGNNRATMRKLNSSLYINQKKTRQL
jgi:hypothetical protein